MSPELMFDMEYSYPSDIFSFGVLIAEVISGKAPSMQSEHLIRSPADGFTFLEDDLRGCMPKNAPFSLVELCVQCCADEADDRPIAQDIFEWAEELEAELHIESQEVSPSVTPEKAAREKPKFKNRFIHLVQSLNQPIANLQRKPAQNILCLLKRNLGDDLL